MPVEVPETPNVMDVYDVVKRPDSVPQDVPYDELTPAQQQLVQDAYRFSGYRPGVYQGITGVNNCI